MQEDPMDELQRSVAAMALLVSGPTRFGSLDPAHVLIGGGAAFTEQEKRELSLHLGATDKHLVYMEFSFDGIGLRLQTHHVAAPRKNDILWRDHCVLWTPTATGEVKLVPMDRDARGHFINRGGKLKYVASRPKVTQEGVVNALRRMASIVERLDPADYAGQSLEDLGDRGVRYWQTQGFKIREEGRELTPEQAAAIHRFRGDG